MSKTTYKRSERVIHRLHTDILFGKGSGLKMQCTVDDRTRKSWLQEMQSKDQTLVTFQSLQRQLENDKAPYKVAVHHSDSEGVYNSTPWREYREAAGIVHEPSTPFRHGGNGVVENRIKAIGYGG